MLPGRRCTVVRHHVFHAFWARLPDWKAAATLVRKIAENYKLAVLHHVTHVFGARKNHGYILSGAGTDARAFTGGAFRVYSLITGYPSVKNWNDGKSGVLFADRVEYDLGIRI